MLLCLHTTPNDGVMFFGTPAKAKKPDVFWKTRKGRKS
jgi:hypothetical protein